MNRDKDLTAEIAEGAEAKMAKISRRRGKRKKEVSFLMFSGRPKFPMASRKRISACSASSSGILLSSWTEGAEEERFYYPRGEKNHKPQRSGRTQRG
jgi:hypothetical protein